MKPHTSFASRVKRLGELGPKSEAPGPGQYHKDSEWVKRKTSNSQWSAGIQQQHALLPNPPSIPSHNNVFGYEENGRGELIR